MIHMQTTNAELYWINWHEMHQEAKSKNDDSIYDIPPQLYQNLCEQLGEHRILEWAMDEPFDGKNFELTVFFGIDSKIISKNRLQDVVLHLSKQNPQIVFLMRTYNENKAIDQFCQNGKWNTHYIDYDTGKLISQ